MRRTAFVILLSSAFLFNWAWSVDTPPAGIDEFAYTAMLNARGTFESDLTVIRRARNRYYLVTGTAQAARDAGFRHVYNVADGFEGHLDPDGHRGQAGGWKASGLPWRQK